MANSAGTRPSCMTFLQGEAACFDRIDPILGSTASSAPACTAADATRAVNTAARAFAAWSATAPAERRRILMRAAEILRDSEHRIAPLMMAEIGAPRAWIRMNMRLASEHLEEAAALTTQAFGHVTQDMRAFAFREAVGVCLAIAPWNAPLVLASRAVATALALGNTVVLKASELSPATHLLIGQILTEAGLPEGVLNIVTHPPETAGEVVEALIAHEAVRRVNFTGSTRVGRLIAETAARHLKRCLLELGGKAPFLVLEDADLDLAAEEAAFGAFMNQGQVCMATDRIIVVEPVADRFAALLAAKAQRLRAGDPRSGKWPLGPIVSPQVARRLSDLVGDAERRGARIRAGGAANGVFMDATVIDHVTPGMAVYHEECFGPIATICRAVSDAEAVFIANDTAYGLSSAVFSRDLDRAMRIARQIDAGICHINATTLSDRADMPFGGVKDSGYGRFGGRAALDEFTETRWISLGPSGPRPGFGEEAREGNGETT